MCSGSAAEKVCLGEQGGEVKLQRLHTCCECVRGDSLGQSSPPTVMKFERSACRHVRLMYLLPSTYDSMMSRLSSHCMVHVWNSASQAYSHAEV